MTEPSSVEKEEQDLLSVILAHVDDRLGSDELTVSQCLRKLFSTKQRPSKFVQSLLVMNQQQSSTANLQETHETIMQHLSRVTNDLPCILSIKIIATVLFFIQLLLEESSNSAQQDQQQQQRNIQMTMILLQALPKTCNNDTMAMEPAVASIVPRDMPHGATVRAFCVGALLKALNPYVATAPMLLSPLFKTLCDSLCWDTMPHELTKGILVALAVYLKQGEGPCLQAASGTANSSNPQQELFHAKVLGFLVARVSIVLPLCIKTIDNDEDDDTDQNNDEDETLTKLFDLLFRIRGISQAAGSGKPPKIADSYRVLEQKVDQCILKTLRAVEDPTTTVRMVLSTNAASSKHDSFESKCSRLGTLSIFNLMLEQIPVSTPEVAKLLLLVAERVVFSLLPHEPGRSHDEVVASVIRVALSLEGPSLHRMFLKWLSTSQHPTTREIVVSIVHHYSICLLTPNSHDSPRSSMHSSPTMIQSVKLLELLAQAFYDVRTLHRSAIAGVLFRLLANSTVRPHLEPLLLSQLVVLLKNLQTMKATTTPTLQDCVCILQLSVTLDYSTSDTLQRHVSSFLEDLGTRDDAASGGTGIFHLGRRPPMEISLLLVGIRSESLKVAGWFLTQTQRRKTGAPLTRNGTILTCSILWFLSKSGVTIGPAVFKLLSWTVQQIKRLLSHHKEDRAVSVALTTGKLLCTLELTAATPTNVVDQLAVYFHSLFQLKVWTITANTMSCLMQVVATLPKSHQGFLPKCLPVEVQSLFKCRLQKIVYKRSSQTPSLDEMQQACENKLKALIPRQVLPTSKNASPFATGTTTTMHVLAPGSFVLSMPTVNNRSALVVFPPGDQSLEDIKHMLQKDSLEGVTQLRQVRLSGNDNGSSCRLYSTKYIST